MEIVILVLCWLLSYCGYILYETLYYRVEHPPSGRVMEVSTTEPGQQLYTSYYLKDVKGKGGAVYGQFSALCLETQHYADSVNHVRFLKHNILR